MISTPIKYLLKKSNKETYEVFLKIKGQEKYKKYMVFVFLTKVPPCVKFLELFPMHSLSTSKIHFYVDPIKILNITRFGNSMHS
jgi:hypothetical protein